MAYYKMELSQTRTQNWIVRVEASSEEEARKFVGNSFDEEYGLFIDSDLGDEGDSYIKVVEDDGPIGVPGPLEFESISEEEIW